MTDESKGRQLHAESWKLHEEKKFAESLQVGLEAMEAYRADNDMFGFSEMVSLQSKTFQDFSTTIDFREYLIIAKHLSAAAIEIAEATGDISSTILPLFDSGGINEKLGNRDYAIELYRKAIERMETAPPTQHNRKSKLAEMKGFLATAEYKNGDKSALVQAEQAIKDLEDSKDANPYELGAWLSGAHMRIAQMLKEDDLQKAKEHLQKAKEIIDNDPELVIRKEQWEKLAASFT